MEQQIYKPQYTMGEWLIKDYLDLNHIPYRNQYEVEINGRKHIFDFALLYKRKVKCYVEFDGKQHFEAVGAFGGEKGLHYRQARDAEKDDYCKQSGICLVRISTYNEGEIKAILDRELPKVNWRMNKGLEIYLKKQAKKRAKKAQNAQNKGKRSYKKR